MQVLFEGVQKTEHSPDFLKAGFNLGFMAQNQNLKLQGQRLAAFRKAAGLSLRELAGQIGEQHTNVLYWERSGNLPRSNVLIPMAKALGITVEELLGEGKSRRPSPLGGKLGRVFEEAAKLPRRQQQKIIEMAEAYIAQYQQSRKESTH